MYDVKGKVISFSRLTWRADVKMFASLVSLSERKPRESMTEAVSTKATTTATTKTMAKLVKKRPV